MIHWLGFGSKEIGFVIQSFLYHWEGKEVFTDDSIT